MLRLCSRSHWRRLFALAAVLAVGGLLAAACAEDAEVEPDELDLADKTRVTVEAEFGTSSIPRAGRQEIWVTRSVGWDPCPEVVGARHPPPTCWIRVLIDDVQVAVVLPEPDGSFGPFPVAVHFDVFDIAPGAHQIQLVQVGRLEVRATPPGALQVEPPPAEGSAAA